MALIVTVATGCRAARAPAPEADTTTVPREAVLAAARDLIARTPFATLVTLDEAGAPQARVVEPFPVEGEGGDFTVWIATTGASRKIAHIERDARVALSYFDRDAPGYVTLTGTAAVVRDPAEKAKRWKETWRMFYKDANRGDDYTLIRVSPARLEISSPMQGMNNDPVTWRAVTVAVGR